MSSKLQIPPEFDEAPIHQRIEFVQDLWDRIASDPENVPIPDEHLRIIDERLRESPTSPEGSRLWSEVEAELLARRRRP